MDNKSFRRKSDNKVISGVCSGLAEYFNLDPMLVRMLFVLLGLLTAVLPFVIVYFILAIITPEGE